MRPFILGLVSTLLFVPTSKGAVNSLKQTNVNWNNNASWNLNRLPQNGDTVIIPSGLTVVVSNNVYNVAPTLYLKVSGTISFQPNGKLDLESSSSVEIFAGGKILSNSTGSERIVIGGVIKYKGNNDGIITGYALANSQSPASGSGPGSGFLSGTLAIGLKNFQAVKTNGRVYINWQTDYEKDADFFEIQYTYDKTDWKMLDRIKAFNLSTGNNYNYTDSNPVTKDLYFRLKLVQKNGTASYSSISLVKYDNLKSKITIYPNPTSGYALVSFNDSFKKGTLTLSNFEGHVVQSKSVNSTSGYVKLEMTSLPKGIYIMEIRDQSGSLQSEKLILR